MAKERNLAFSNICVLHFGQLGDVLLSLPAIGAVRGKFPEAKITLIAGKVPAELVLELKVVDEVIAVDRVGLLHGNKLRSIGKILKLVSDVRRRRFDLVIDLHSLYETNILGFLSGAKHRLFANRESRSLDMLGSFDPRPPKEDKNIHLADNYLAVLKPLVIENAQKIVRITPTDDQLSAASSVIPDESGEQTLVGMVVGAGHPSRRWPLRNFAELSGRLSHQFGLRTVVFLGPEEENERSQVEASFAEDTIIVSGLTLAQLAAAFTKVSLLISNDTGPPHLAALVGTPIVLIIDERGPLRFLPLSESLEVVRTAHVQKIAVKDGFDAAVRALAVRSTEQRADQEKEPKQDQADQGQQH